jgi:alpha-tubulin suppressor-like RCC1 family protein
MSRLSLITIAGGVWLLSALGLAGCGSGDANGGAAAENVGSAEIELKSVPATGVSCIAVTVQVAGQTIKKLLPVAANGVTSNLSLGQLPLGTATFSGNAYGLTCTDATVTAGTAQANWIADPINLRLQEGVVSSAPLTFRRVNTVTASANFVDNVKSIVAGGQSTYAVMTDGTVKYWGRLDGTTGPNPATTTVALPVAITGVASVSAAQFGGFACAIKTDGTVWCWGSNPRGQLGNGTLVTSTTPTKVNGVQNVTTLALGVNHACAGSETTAHIWCWGFNGVGQLGNGTTTSSLVPVEVSFGFRPHKLALGAQSSCAMLASGAVVCWGNNNFGQLGDGSTLSESNPVSVSLDSAVLDIGSGDFDVCAIKLDGTIACWGYNGNGQLGNGSTTSSLLPVPVVGLRSMVMLSSGSEYSCAENKSAQLFCWGANDAGQLGMGSSTNSLGPSPVIADSVTGFTAGDGHTCAMLDGQTLLCWGDNSSGQLGTGDYLTAFSPKVSGLQ